MKKTLVLMAILCLVLAGCKKKKSTELEYLGENPIEMALLDQVALNVKSDYPVTVKSLNEKYVTVVSDTEIKGKNVGSAVIEMTNDYETVKVPVNVRLFKEPSLNFGCSKSDILAKYGQPDYQVGDSIYIYGNYNVTSMFVSHTCTQMNYLFSQSGQYIESHVFIIDKYNTLLERYLTENFNPYDTVAVEADSVYYFYKDKTHSNIYCGRYNEANQWNDTWLFYYMNLGRETEPKIFTKPKEIMLSGSNRTME